MNAPPLSDALTHDGDLAGLNMPELLDRAATSWPSRPALHIVATGEKLTYADLREQVDAVRSGLEDLGVKPGDKVALMLRNQVEFPLAWLAVVEAGAVCVPINPRYTTKEAHFVLNDTEASWLICADDLLDTVVSSAAPSRHLTRVIAVGGQDDEFARLRSHPFESRRHEAVSSELVGIQFTSGTTGLPKGCMLTHEYWVTFGVYGSAMFSHPQSYLADHPFYYMQNQAYMMMAMVGGGQMHVTPGLSRRKFLNWLVDLEIDFAWIDEELLDAPATSRDTQLQLKFAPVSGLPPRSHQLLEERFDLMAREWYASTEVGSGMFLPWDRTDMVGSGSMGLEVPLRETMIVDGSLNELAPDTVGELLIRGPGMMLGYWNRPETNAELFLPDGWFRTGDLVRKDAAGFHYYVGRTRDIVRRSGENIAAVEVERHIEEMPEVATAAVIPVPDRSRGEEVKVIIVAHPGSTLTAERIRAFALEGLAPFKVPRYVEFREDLPMTGSGKVRKSTLQAEEPLNERTIDLAQNR